MCLSAVASASGGDPWCSRLSISRTALNDRQRKSTMTKRPFGRLMRAFCSNAATPARRSSPAARASGDDQAPAVTSLRARRRCALPRRGPAASSSASSATEHRLRRTASATSARTSSRRSRSRARSATARASGARRGPGSRAGSCVLAVCRTRTQPTDRTATCRGTRTRTEVGHVTDRRCRSVSAAAPDSTDCGPAKASAAAWRSGQVNVWPVRYTRGSTRRHRPVDRRCSIALLE